jgi:hypothetical protein
MTFSGTTLTGALTVDAGNAASEASAFSTSGNVVGAIILDENSGGAASLATTGSAAAVTLTGTIASGNAGEGDIVFGNTHASGTTVTGIVGTTGIGTLEVSTGASGTFNDNVVVVAIDSSGTSTFKQSVTSTTLKSSGTMNFTNAAAETIAGTITENSSSDTTKMIVKNSADAAGAILTVSGAVTLDSIEVGAASGDGASAKFDGNVVASGGITIFGGDEDDEDNLANFNDSNLTGDVTFVDGTNSGIAILASAGSSAMTFTGAVAGAGNLDINNTATTTVTGSIGTSSTSITSIDVATGADLIVNSDIYSTTSTLNGTGVLKLDGAATQTVGNAIVAGADDEGDILISNTSTGGSIFDETIGARDTVLNEITIEDENTVKFSKALATATLDINGGTITFEENNNLNGEADTSGKVEIAGAPTIVLTSNIAASETVFVSDETAAADALDISSDGATVIIPSNFTSGTITLLSQAAVAGKGAIGTEDLAVEAALFTAQDNALYDYSIASSGTGNINIDITVAAKADNTIASELKVTNNQAQGMLQANSAASSDSTLLEIWNNALNSINGGLSADVAKLSKQVSPQTDLISGSSVAAQAVTGSIQGIMSNRMASLRSGDAYFGTGVAAGGMSAQSGFIQVFGSTGEQKSTKVGSGTQAGFDSDTQGVAIGFDGISDNGMTVGVSVATANTDVDGKGTGKSVNSIDTYSASLYMDRATDAGYVEGSLSFGVNENSISRRITSAGLNRTLSGSYDSQSLSLNLTAGVPNEFASGFFLTPFGSFTATSMDVDAYTKINCSK